MKLSTIRKASVSGWWATIDARFWPELKVWFVRVFLSFGFDTRVRALWSPEVAEMGG
jgi:hypothetical protein